LQLQQVAQIIRNRDALEANRDAFFVQQDGYDTHANNMPRLNVLLDDLDEALLCFTEELKAQGVWDKTAIVLASDFGRSLPSNGLGTDHGELCHARDYFIVLCRRLEENKLISFPLHVFHSFASQNQAGEEIILSSEGQ
jgi:uncharacterized protein (DUF1501 family)